MKTQTPLTNMEGRWVHSTKDAFDALVEMGYEPFNKKYLNRKVLNLRCGAAGYIICQDLIPYTSEQAYYHNGYFYDEPYEEFTITEEKVPFPEREDIKWIMIEALIGYPVSYLATKTSWDFGAKVDFISEDRYKEAKWFHENSKDFKVTWKLKEKINRKLHENRPLALAIGRAIVEGCISEKLITPLNSVRTNNVGFHMFNVGVNNPEWIREYTLPDDYIIPDQVIEWMKEYDHTS